MLKPIPPPGGRQGANDLALLLKRCVEVLDRRLKIRKLELRLEHEQVLSLLDAFLETVFFVLGQDLQNAAIKADLLADRLRGRGRRLCLHDPVDGRGGRGNVLEGLARCGLLHQPAQERNGLEQNVKGLPAQGHLAEPEFVEQEFQLVRELRGFLEPEHAGESFEGMDRAKQGIYLIRVNAAGCLSGFEGQQRPACRLQDVLRLGEKVFYGTV